MKGGARNQLRGKVTDIKRGTVMAQIRLTVPAKSAMSSVITVDSLDELDVKIGDELILLVKAINVLPVKLASH